ncbi:hypothetical protein [Stenotrophomonas sp.]|uniref:hypothetical protein n=1 Tax=Stenotrophomonas sp. TaxID=69392 RepID=UPI003C387B44
MDLIEALRRRIDEYKGQMSEFLLAGGASTTEAYAKIVGKAEALELILTDLHELEQRYIEE